MHGSSYPKAQHNKVNQFHTIFCVCFRIGVVFLFFDLHPQTHELEFPSHLMSTPNFPSISNLRLQSDSAGALHQTILQYSSKGKTEIVDRRSRISQLGRKRDAFQFWWQDDLKISARASRVPPVFPPCSPCVYNSEGVPPKLCS